MSVPLHTTFNGHFTWNRRKSPLLVICASSSLIWTIVFIPFLLRYNPWATTGALNHKMLKEMTIIVSKMTSHCAGTVHMREESESGIRKWEEMWFKTTAEDGERGGGSSDIKMHSSQRDKAKYCSRNECSGCHNGATYCPSVEEATWSQAGVQIADHAACNHQSSPLWQYCLMFIATETNWSHSHTITTGRYNK